MELYAKISHEILVDNDFYIPENRKTSIIIPST